MTYAFVFPTDSNALAFVLRATQRFNLIAVRDDRRVYVIPAPETNMIAVEALAVWIGGYASPSDPRIL